MRSPAALALAALLSSANHAAAFDASGQVLSFASARAGVCLFEPRVTISEARQTVTAGDALEFELFVPDKCAERAGVEITFADGRRSLAPLVERIGEWHHVRVVLDGFADAVRFELVARGALADEIGFRVDDVKVTHTSAEPSIVFTETLLGGTRILRDDKRQSGAAVVDVATALDGVRTVIDRAQVLEPWHVYDLGNVRRSSDGVPAERGPLGGALVGPCVPMHFAERGDHQSFRAEGQKFLFDPLEGGRYYTVWLALSTIDGEALQTRYFAFGEAGEHRAIGLSVPKRGDPEGLASDLGACLLVSSRIASTVSLEGIELPNEPRLRVHAISFQWHRDGASDERFYTEWLREQAAVPNGLSRERVYALSRWCGSREIGPSFADNVVESKVERDMFTALMHGKLPEFDAALRSETARQATCGAPLKQLHLALEDVRDGRGVVRVESGTDPESMLRAFAAQAGTGAFVLEGDLAFLAQAPQVMTGFGSSIALLSNGPRIARWSGPGDTSVVLLSPFRILKDAREFADLPWRQWKMGVAMKASVPDLMLAVDGSARARADAKGIVKRLAGLACMPDIHLATAEAFVGEAVGRIGLECPTFAPGPMNLVPDDAVQRLAERAPALRRGANAVAALSVLATPSCMDGSEYPRASIDELRAAVQALDATDPDADVQRIVERAESELARELDVVMRGSSTVGKGTPFVAFNAMPWSRHALVELESTDGMLLGADGAALPWQATTVGSRVFSVEVPALGYQVLRGLTGNDEAQIDERERVRVKGWTAQNDRMSFTIDPSSGAVTSLALVAEKLELLSAPAHPVGERWEIESAEFTEKGPLRAVARVVLAGDRRRLELEYKLEARSHALEVTALASGDKIAWRIPGAHNAVRALLGVPFGWSVAVPHGDGRPARQRIMSWAALTDGSDGFGILAGDLATVLVEKEALAPELPSSARTRFALVPFAGDWRKASLAERAAEFATPFALIATDAHAGARAASHSFMSVARVKGFERIEGPESGVVMTTFEPVKDDGAFMVRLVETHGTSASITLDFDRPVFDAKLVDLRGNVKSALRVVERRVELALAPNCIETVRVQLRP